MITTCLARFLADEGGAVMVDWVTLAGAMIGLAVLIVLHVAEGATAVSTRLEEELSNAHVTDISDLLSPQLQSSGTGTSSSVAP